MTLPNDAQARKDTPLATGVLDYFPDALAAVAAVSRVGNEQHNPGQPLHWDKSKSTDHADSLLRHLAQRGFADSDGMRHTAKVAWRALALLQTELEEAEAEGQPEQDLLDMASRGPGLGNAQVSDSEDLKALMVTPDGRTHVWDLDCGFNSCRRARVADVALDVDDDVSEALRRVNG